MGKYKNMGYTHCTIDAGKYGSFLAKVEYSYPTDSWGPTAVFYEYKWIDINDFQSLIGYGQCEYNDYRKEQSEVPDQDNPVGSFYDAAMQIRNEFVKTAFTYDVGAHNKLRTEIDSLLIMYDQAIHKAKNLDEISEGIGVTGKECCFCDSQTEVVFNIKMKAKPVCESCATSIFLQQAKWYSEQK